MSPQSLKEHGKLRNLKDGVKILGGSGKKSDGALPTGLKFRDIVFSATAREALSAVGADFGDTETATAE